MKRWVQFAVSCILLTLCVNIGIVNWKLGDQIRSLEMLATRSEVTDYQIVTQTRRMGQSIYSAVDNLIFLQETMNEEALERISDARESADQQGFALARRLGQLASKIEDNEAGLQEVEESISILDQCTSDLLFAVDDNAEGIRDLRCQSTKHANQILDVLKLRLPSVVAICFESASRLNLRTGEPVVLVASGVVVSKDGIILTASHVVDDIVPEEMARMWVKFEDGTEREFEKWAHTKSGTVDVGVIWIDPSGLDLCPITSSEWKRDVEVGEGIVAIGSPNYYYFSARFGIVSYVNRLIEDPRGITQVYTQIDAAVNGGDSGGPVFDLNGNLIGIVSWGVIPAYGEGMHFIVPIDEIVRGLMSIPVP